MGLGLLLPASLAWAFTVSYDQTVRMGSEESQSKVVIRDRMFRIEQTVDTHLRVTVRNPRGIFVYYPQDSIGAQINAMDASQRQLLDHAANFPEYLRRQNARLVTEESIRELACEVYLVEDRSAGDPMKVWLWKEEHFPLRLQVISGRGKITVDLRNIQLGVSAPAALFELPIGLKLTDPDTLRAFKPRQVEVPQPVADADISG